MAEFLLGRLGRDFFTDYKKMANDIIRSTCEWHGQQAHQIHIFMP